MSFANRETRDGSVRRIAARVLRPWFGMRAGRWSAGSRGSSLVRSLNAAVIVVGAVLLGGCDQTVEVSFTWLNQSTVRAAANVNGKVQTFEGRVGTDGCVEWDMDGCKGKVCGVQPGTPFKVTCSDPLLMEWPDNWVLLSAHWSAPDLGLGGELLVSDAASWILPDSFGVIVTDPGYSAHVLKLDFPGSIPPTFFHIEMIFDVPVGTGRTCLKAVDVASVELDPAPRYIVPTDPAGGVDFTRFGPGDPRVMCFDLTDPSAVPDPSRIRIESWGKVKSMHR